MKPNRAHLDSSPIIDGRALPSTGRKTLPLYNPADETVIGSVVCASSEDICHALEIAETARQPWRNSSPSERGAILIRAAGRMRAGIQEYAATLTLEQGKLFGESLAEWGRAIETFEWHGREAERLNAALAMETSTGKRTIVPEPTGIVAAFTPWNYPAVLIARKLAAALVAGCPVILKAAEETPNTAVIITQILLEAGLPCNALQLLFGKPEEVSSLLLASPSVRVMSFTGSTPVGKQLARLAADRLIRTVLELGGHSPVVISADADIEQTATAIGAYKYECAGQSCNAPSRIYVEQSAYAAFVAAFVELSEKLVIGAGSDPQANMGPMANSRRIAAMEMFVSDAKSHGGRIACGGARLPRPGYFFPPTVLLDAGQGAKVFVDEPFGPVLPIMPVDSIEEGIARADANPYGLASYIFAKDIDLARRVASRFEAGSVGVNQLRGVAPDAPSSGIKDSGYGYEGGDAGVHAFQNRKLISGIGG